MLLALAALIVLSLAPVLGHHVFGAVSWFPASQQHLGIFCLVALHHLLAPVHEAFHVLLLLGIAYASAERGRAIWRHRRTMGALVVRVPLADSPLSRAAEHAGLARSNLRVIHGSPNPAFTTGWWRPRVYVAADLGTRLTEPELEAVLAHEAEHLRRRDPLRLFALRCLADVLFWLPAIRRLVDDLADEAEITADDAAARRHALPLASAILAMAGATPSAVEPAVGFERTDLLERRIRRLAGEEMAIGTHVSRCSIAAAASALFVVWLSGTIVLHPLPPSDTTHALSTHCVHDESLFAHLFCRDTPPAGVGTDCPHAAAATAHSPST
ncbi:MAG: M56 family metallopeptidase [Gemmatimonadetes bacterium]|nr:M56 family metallopeptidase [Gemmatimonadota bacterium]